MKFTRKIDSQYPRVWDTWKDGDVTWVVQDLPPEDDEEAIQILLDNLCTDETLCSLCDLVGDPESIQGMSDYWRHCLNQRMSLACYAETANGRTFVALNVCIVLNEGEEIDHTLTGKKWQNVYHSLEYVEEKRSAYKYLGETRLLSALGLVVRREYRGSKLGGRLLAAREPLSLSQGIKGTVTVFTGIASQKLAARCGFETISEASVREMAESGLDYPKTNDTMIKQMVKKFS